MTFLWPKALILSILVALILLLYFFFKKRSRPHKKSHLLTINSEFIAKKVRKTKSFFRLIYSLIFVSALCLVVALARPSQTIKQLHRWIEGIDILLVVDISESMAAGDFKPDRMTVAKKVITDFVNQRETDRIGLITFGGESVTLSPLTRDYAFIKKQISRIQLRELKQGTAIGMALASAVRLMKSLTQKKFETARERVVVLITDGDSNVGTINPITAAHLAQDHKIKVYCIGIGKDKRVIVPIYSYDLNGKKKRLLAKVPSYLNPEILEKIAELTGGKSYMASNSQALSDVLNEINSLERKPLQVKTTQSHDEKYMWAGLFSFVLLLTSLLLLETRFKRMVTQS